MSAGRGFVVVFAGAVRDRGERSNCLFHVESRSGPRLSSSSRSRAPGRVAARSARWAAICRRSGPRARPFGVGQAQVFPWGHVARARRAVPSRHAAPAMALVGDAVVKRGDVGDQRPPTHRRELFAALLQSAFWTFELRSGPSARGRTFHHHLDVVLPARGELAEGFSSSANWRRIKKAIVLASRDAAITQRKTAVVALEDLEMSMRKARAQRVLLVVISIHWARMPPPRLTMPVRRLHQRQVLASAGRHGMSLVITPCWAVLSQMMCRKSSASELSRSSRWHTLRSRLNIAGRCGSARWRH